MHFRLYSRVWGVVIREGDELSVECGGSHQVRVRVRQSNQEDQAKGFEKLVTVCITSLQIEPSAEIALTFDRLANRLPPIGWENVEGSQNYLDESGRIKEGWLLPKEKMPAGFQEFHRQIDKELGEATVQTVNLLRWRSTFPGPHNPLGFRPMEWSLEGENWSLMPGPAGYFEAGQVVSQWSLESWLGAEISKLFANGVKEPVGHELFREAWCFRDSHKRSSLVMGIAAAEVALKECVADLIPDATWIVENLPSPPLVNMLRDCLPHLPARCKINDKPLALPESMLKVLNKGVVLRNQITHVGRKEPDLTTLEEVLLAVQDVLWILDFYRGFSWSLAYVRSETRTAMGIWVPRGDAKADIHHFASPHQRLALHPLPLKPVQQLDLMFLVAAGNHDQPLLGAKVRTFGFALGQLLQARFDTY